MQTIFHWHSFIEIIHKDARILIDPYITWNPLCDVDIKSVLSRNIDAIIITQWLEDHFGDTFEIQKSTKCKVITNNDLAPYFKEELWISQIREQWIWVKIEYAKFDVTLFPVSYNTWWWIIWSEYTNTPSWVIVEIGWFRIYHAWDTWLFSDFKVFEQLKNIDVAFLPIWGKFTMWSEDAVFATSHIQPKYVVPIHYDTWDNIKVDHLEFAWQVMLWNKAVPKVLKPGQSIVL